MIGKLQVFTVSSSVFVPSPFVPFGYSPNSQRLSSTSPTSSIQSLIMFFAFYTLLVTLVLSSLARCDNARRCHNDACLRSFEQNHDGAQRYCAEHPDPMWMSPAPGWANECDSLGRNNNMRHRLASACSCLHKPKATDQTVYMAENSPCANMSTTQITTALATPTVTDTSIAALNITSGPAIPDEAVATSTLSSSRITAMGGEDETIDTK